MDYLIVLGVVFAAIPISVLVTVFIDERQYFNALMVGLMGFTGIIILGVSYLKMSDEDNGSKEKYELIQEPVYRKIK